MVKIPSRTARTVIPRSCTSGWVSWDMSVCMAIFRKAGESDVHLKSILMTGQNRAKARSFQLKIYGFNTIKSVGGVQRVVARPIQEITH